MSHNLGISRLKHLNYLDQCLGKKLYKYLKQWMKNILHILDRLTYENQMDTKVVENNYVWGIHSVSDAGKKLIGQAYFEQ